MLHVDHVSYSRNDESILSGVSLSVKPGILMQIEGANGSGKTTLIKLMSGLLEPEEGTVSWHSKPIDATDSLYRGDFAYVGHKSGLKPDLTARENIEVYASLSGGRDWMTPDDALDQVGVKSLADTLCSEMSAGQKKRVTLARLLVRKVTLWLLDEPFANLDSSGGDMLKSMISEHLAAGMVAVSTHRRINWDGMQVETYLVADE